MISIITTIYNGAKFLEEAFQSVAEQTFQDFEWVIIDDGSTDNSIQLIDQGKIKYKQLQVNLIQAGRLGRGKALNFGISRAKYDWIAILDIDDLWHPEKLAYQLNIANSGSSDVITTTALIFENQQDLSIEKSANISSTSSTSLTLKSMLYSNKIMHSSVLIRKSIANYDEDRSSQFDLELWLRLLLKNKTFTRIDFPFTYRRVHQSQLFEGSKGNYLYGLKSLKLKIIYSIKSLLLLPLLWNILKIGFVLLPKTLKLKITSKPIKGLVIYSGSQSVRE